MAEYIEREAAIKGLMNDAPEQVGYCREDAADYIRYMDAADVAPVVHGRWLYEPKFGSTRPYHCSLPDCGASYPGRFLFCPNCGAKMDKEESHE